ncbi:MAG TPA: ATP-grasp domain-containing protein [Burkholderiales bacterium]|nr:ATP-grasp domain-containing protein [Burkholderiales bacterium]
MMRILICPSGTEIGLEIHDALARRRDVELVGAESTENSHAAFVFEDNHLVPHSTDASFVEALNALVRERRIDYVFPAHDDVQLALLQAPALLACKLISSPRQTVEVSRFKSRTYALLKDRVAVPRVFDGYAQAAAQLPVFVKPDRGQGSQNTHLCRSEAQLTAALESGPDMLICEYLGGREVTVDCFSDRETGLLYADARLRVRTRAGISVRAAHIDLPAAEPLAKAIASRLSFHGAWFFQLRERAPGDWVLLEVGARISGGATYQRLRGVNLPLLSVFEAARQAVTILPQKLDVVMDRAFVSRFKLDLAFANVYVDYDDTLCLRNEPNLEVLSLVILARHRGKKVILLSRNEGGCRAWLKERALDGLFDEVVLLDRDRAKPGHMAANSILIDDSFAERLACSRAGIMCFDTDAVPALVDHLRRTR